MISLINLKLWLDGFPEILCGMRITKAFLLSALPEKGQFFTFKFTLPHLILLPQSQWNDLEGLNMKVLQDLKVKGGDILQIYHLSTRGRHSVRFCDTFVHPLKSDVPDPKIKFMARQVYLINIPKNSTVVWTRRPTTGVLVVLSVPSFICEAERDPATAIDLKATTNDQYIKENWRPFPFQVIFFISGARA